MFQFKQFTIQQNKCAMKVGTDGVLLGAWTNVENTKQILDIGTGTGLIALMLAQRQPNAEIDAIEIEENAYKQAVENIQNTKWQDRISVFHSSLQEFETNKKYDLIVSNPPYFSQSLKNPDIYRKTARHNDTLSQHDLLENSKRLLQNNCRLAVIYPAYEALTFLNIAKEIGFHCLRITHIIPTIGRKAKRLLIELCQNPCVLTENEICIEKEKRHEYTEEYKNLTKDFYLNF
jgi:tRNA1Val (adenine37-N6)-methyltransferase